MGVISHIRQSLLDAQQYAAARATYDRAPAGLRRPAESATLDALGLLLRRELPVVFVADSDEMIRRAQAIAREFNLRPIIAGARQGYELPSELKNVPVFVSVKWPAAPVGKEDREEQPLRVIRERQLAPTTPAVLVREGVQFALVSGPGKTGDFIPGIRKAIENGLTAEDALRATTIWPARILGVDRQLGSLERGKIANVVITDKPMFGKDGKIRRLLVDGREVRLPSEEQRAATTAAAEAASPVAGSWSVTVRMSEGSVSLQLTLRVEGQQVTGTYSGDRGSGDIRNGRFDGTAIEFTIGAMTDPNAGEMSDWVFRGTVEGDTMAGNVTTTVGTFQFSGSRAR
jgi:hypothetical protein